MHLKDLHIDISYRATNATYSKGSSNLSVKNIYLILPFKMSVFSFEVNRYCQKEEHWLFKNHC